MQLVVEATGHTDSTITDLLRLRDGRWQLYSLLCREMERYGLRLEVVV